MDAGAITIVLAATVRLSVPAFGDTTGCPAGGPFPIGDQFVTLYGQRRYAAQVETLGVQRGAPGAVLDFTWNDAGEVWTVWARSRRVEGGRESCASRPVGVNLPALDIATTPTPPQLVLDAPRDVAGPFVATIRGGGAGHAYVLDVAGRRLWSAPWSGERASVLVERVGAPGVRYLVAVRDGSRVVHRFAVLR